MKNLYIMIWLLSAMPITTKSQSFTSLPPGLSPSPSTIFYSSDSNLYTGGTFNTLANGTIINLIAQWKNNQWDSLGSGVNDGGVIKEIIEFNDTIYVAGTYNKIGGVISNGLATWNGSFWNYVGDFTTNQGYGSVFSLETHNGSLYIGGGFNSLNGSPAYGLVRYDSTGFYSYPILGPWSPTVSAICFYNGELYVGGNFQPGGGKNDIVKWDGTNWVSVGGGLSGGNTVVDDMIVYNGELYMSGHFLTLYGDPGNLIAKWDGTNWSSVGIGLDGGNCFAMEVFNNELYVGGTLISAGGIPVNNIAKWDGTSWHNIGANFNNAVTCLEAKDSTSLFIGGGFTTVNGDTVNRICEYNIITGINEVSNKTPIQISPNPATNFIDIQSNHGFIDNIQLFDISGKIVLEQKDDEILNCRIDVSSIANGIYFLKVFSDNSVYVEKLMIQKL